jgi:hypothetical protein
MDLGKAVWCIRRSPALRDHRPNRQLAFQTLGCTSRTARNYLRILLSCAFTVINGRNIIVFTGVLELLALAGKKSLVLVPVSCQLFRLSKSNSRALLTTAPLFSLCPAPNLRLRIRYRVITNSEYRAKSGSAVKSLAGSDIACAIRR